MHRDWKRTRTPDPFVGDDEMADLLAALEQAEGDWQCGLTDRAFSELVEVVRSFITRWGWQEVEP